MHEATFLQDLAIVMIVAGIVTVIFHRLKQPVVLGYILAGVIIGPHTPPFPLVADQNAIQTLSELGVIFLMFSLGLGFSFRKLKAVGATAFIAATLKILLMVWAGYVSGRLFGWNQMDSIFLGAILSISSTIIIVKVLEDMGRAKEKFSELIIGILIVEDILAIVMIALLSGFATTGSLQTYEVLRTILQLGLFLVVVVILGLLFIPRLLSFVAGYKSNEMLLITVIGICFGVSLVTVKLGYSVALGAFLIGAIIAESRAITRIEMLTRPIRDMFSAVFFVAIGLLIDPTILLEYAIPILVITGVVILGKVVTCSIGVFVAGNGTGTSLRVGMGLAQIGEFSFIIAALGLSLNVTSNFLYPIVVTVSAITTFLTPYLIRNSDRLVGWFDKVAPRSVTNYLELYTRWISQLRGKRSDSLAARLLRKWIWQMGINLCLIAAVFIVAAFFEKHIFAWWSNIPDERPGLRALFWLGSMLISLPLFIATVRKLQAFSMLIAEISVSARMAGPRTAGLQAIVSNTIFAAGCLCLLFLTLLLSSALMPSWNVMIVLIIFLSAAAILLRQQSIKIYSKAQFALQETFSKSSTPLHSEFSDSSLMQEVEIKTVVVSEKSAAVGKLLRELQLRTITGTSILGIKRGDINVINPGPEEKIEAGDHISLLGDTQQLESATDFFTN